jgi:hypothetical protein
MRFCPSRRQPMLLLFETGLGVWVVVLLRDRSQASRDRAAKAVQGAGDRFGWRICEESAAV